MRFKILSIAGPLALLTCCAPSPLPTPAPAPAPAPPPSAPPPPAPPPTAWQDAPLTPGRWSYRSEGQRSAAAYGASGAIPVLTLRCERPSRTISVERTLAAIPATASTITIRTSFGDAQWPAAVADPTRPLLSAQRTATDPLFDKLAYTRGRFMIEASSGGALILPAWPEVARVIEDCRS
jgi:hypothetical protein